MQNTIKQNIVHTSILYWPCSSALIMYTADQLTVSSSVMHVQVLYEGDHYPQLLELLERLYHRKTL